jgi:cytochrome c oxidase subunit IV
MPIIWFILTLIALFQLHRSLEHYTELESERENKDLKQIHGLKIRARVWGLLIIASASGLVITLLDFIELSR